METEIPVQRLHKYNLLYQCGAFSPSDISNIFSEVIVDDIVKTNRIAALIKAAEKAAEDYKALQKENEELKQKEQSKDENNKLGRRGAFGQKDEQLSGKELETGIPQGGSEDVETDPLTEESDADGEQAKDTTGTEAPAEPANADENGKDSDGKTQDENPSRKGGAGEKGRKPRRSSRPPRKPIPDESKEKQKRKPGIWERDTQNLPHRISYDVDDLTPEMIEKAKSLSKLGFEASEKLSIEEAHVVVLTIMKPIIAYSEDVSDEEKSDSDSHEVNRTLYRPYSEGYIMPGSRATPEIVAFMYYMLTSMSIPYKRIAALICHMGYPMKTQKTVYWCNTCAARYLLPVFDYLVSFIIAGKYIQMDETTWRSIYDAEKPGEKSYIWLLITSELREGPKAAAYFFNPSRAESFLDGLFADFLPDKDADRSDTAGQTTPPEQETEPDPTTVTGNASVVCKNDKYAAYPELERKSEGKIVVSFCLAHLRRPFFLAWLIVKMASKDLMKTEEGRKQLAQTWEWKILREISLAESEDTKLKRLSGEERVAGRIKNVKPHLDLAWQYVCEYEEAYQASLHGTSSDPSKRVTMTATMRKAMNYFEDCKKGGHIDSFLYDSNVPADNTYCERNIRRIALQRNSSLFSYSDEGATDRMIANSIATTAELNDADPEYYFRYLLIEIPKHQRRGDNPDEYLPKMMCWSEEYRAYEAKQREATQAGKGISFQSETEPILVNGRWMRDGKVVGPYPAA